MRNPAAIVFDLDPALVRLGPFHVDRFSIGPVDLGPWSFEPEIRYYGVIFVAMLWIGFLLWRWQMTRAGHPRDMAERFLGWGVVAVLAGARLGHCLFYEPERYLSRPLEMLLVWKGGLSSHGATIGLVVALLAFARSRKLPVLEVLDRFSMSAAVGAASVRLGNFLNSEIVGKPTDLPWAVIFKRYDGTPRHPSQIYEFLIGLGVLGALALADRLAGREHRPRGLLAGLFLVLYFSARFLVEFVKEAQVEHEISWPIDTGQILSLPGIAAGAFILARLAAGRLRSRRSRNP